MNAIVILVVLALLAYGTWVHYLAVMMLKQKRSTLPRITQYLGAAVLYIGYALDVLFNIAAFFLFYEIQREWLFTTRVSRHIKETGWRANLAKWICDNWLDPFDKGHCG